VAAHHEEAGGKTQGRRGEPGKRESRERLAPSPARRKQARGVRADAEERGVPEGDDAGVAEDEIEGEGEERDDEDLAAEDEVAGEEEVAGDRDQPEDDFRGMPAAAREIQVRLPYSPAGKAISSTTMRK
jgi:hypothetical protein